MNTKRYFVRTWDCDLDRFTPQKGVRVGPYTLFGLRRALLKLQEMGYSTRRGSAPLVLIEDEENYHLEEKYRREENHR